MTCGVDLFQVFWWAWAKIEPQPMYMVSRWAYLDFAEGAYLPDGEVNLITKGLLPGRGYFIALRFG